MSSPWEGEASPSLRRSLRFPLGGRRQFTLGPQRPTHFAGAAR